MSSHSHDVLIIGHGLAGAVLADRLQQRGLEVHVFDHPREFRATHAAAGIVNPISLRRDVPTWRAKEMMTNAREHILQMERALGVKAWHPLDLIKIFPTQNEVRQWQKAMNSEGSEWISSRPQPQIELNGIHAPFGYGTVENCAWVDLNVLLAAQRHRLAQEGQLSDALVLEQDITYNSGRITVHGHSARWLIQCEGPFNELPGMVPVKGEVLTLRIPHLQLSHILHKGIFLLPIGSDHYKAGSTFVWDKIWTGPTAAGREHLLQRTNALLERPMEIVDHRAGVRPATKDRRPLLGAFGPGRAIFNGLGSRGVSIAAWCADHLAAHLFDGAPLDPEVDLRRFL